MKTTYLVYKQVDGVRQLVAATQEEWDAIMKENRGLPIGQRRCFMKDCFEDGDELDCMYIETTAAEYREWNGNVKKCAVGKHPKSEKLGSTGQAACCARIHSRYFTGGSPSGLRV